MPRKQTRLWKTKDGRKIRLCDMSEAHLRSALAVLTRLHNSYQLSAAIDIPMLQGDIAEYYAEAEQRVALESTPEEIFPIISNIKLELERREQSIGKESW